MEKAADALPLETIAKRWIVGNDPDAVAADIQQYIDWGFNHLVFHAPGHDQRRFCSSSSATSRPGCATRPAARRPT